MKTFAVIGDPIDHSMSPNMHNAAFRELGMESTYIAYRIPRDELEEGVESLKKTGITGFNVTIPHKISMMKYLDRTDESCSMVGATNTVSNHDGTLKGYNTDMDGFLDPIKKRKIAISGESAFVLGAGGAARAIIAGLAKEGASRVTIANRTTQKAQELSLFAAKLGLDALTCAPNDYIQDSRFVINATSIGMGGEDTPIRDDMITQDSIIYDIVYRPIETGLVKKAKQKNAAIIYGYEMLLGQAAIAFEIWHQKKAPYAAMKRALVGAT